MASKCPNRRIASAMCATKASCSLARCGAGKRAVDGNSGNCIVCLIVLLPSPQTKLALSSPEVLTHFKHLMQVAEVDGHFDSGKSDLPTNIKSTTSDGHLKSRVVLLGVVMYNLLGFSPFPRSDSKMCGSQPY
jgi:hypothetical protein